MALNVLPFAATLDGRQLQRFQNEARAAASLETSTLCRSMASAVSAACWQRSIRARRGGAEEWALIAVARRLLGTFNAPVRNRTPWDEKWAVTA